LFAPLQVAEKPSIALSIASALSGGRVSHLPPSSATECVLIFFGVLNSGVTLTPPIHLGGVEEPTLTVGASMGASSYHLLVVWLLAA